MRMRGIIIVDYEIPTASMQEVALEAGRLKDAMDSVLRASLNASGGVYDIKERRTDNLPDLNKVKFRTS